MEVSEKSSADSTVERPLLLPHHSHLTPLLFFGRSHGFRFLSSRPLSPSPCYLFCPPVLSSFLSRVRTLTYSFFLCSQPPFYFPFRSHTVTRMTSAFAEWWWRVVVETGSTYLPQRRCKVLPLSGVRAHVFMAT